MADITRLLLVRHGQSTWNAEKRWQGQADPPLSDHGRRQAVQAAARIGAIDVVAASPQVRAHETAALIAAELGIGPVHVVPDLRERSAGPWSGLTVEEIEQRYPGYLDEGRRPEDFETDEALIGRTTTALEALAIWHPGRLVLVVTHGGVIHNLDEHLGIASGRVPNLWGRVLEYDHARRGAFRGGDRLALIDAELSTGGQPDRI